MNELNYGLGLWAFLMSLVAIGLVWLLNGAYDKNDRMAKAHAEEIKQLQAEKAAIDELYKSVLSAGETQRLQDQAAVNALYGALTECQEQCKALERQTVEVEAIPAKPTTKRNSKRQFEKKVTSE